LRAEVGTTCDRGGLIVEIEVPYGHRKALFEAQNLVVDQIFTATGPPTVPKTKASRRSLVDESLDAPAQVIIVTAIVAGDQPRKLNRMKAPKPSPKRWWKAWRWGRG
jgi:hypothetical protein